MNKVVVIGNSAAGFRCAEALARLGPSLEVTLISRGEGPAYRRDLLLEFLSGARKEKDLHLCRAEDYASLKISLVAGKEASRLDTRKQRVVLKDNTRIAYDWLVVATGVKPAPLEIPGKQKEGVFSPAGLEDFEAIGKRMDIVHTACLIGPAAACLPFARVLLAKGKEVKIIGADIPVGVEPVEQLELIAGAAPAEIIGEGSELKALKLDNGKVIGTSLVVFLRDPVPASDCIRDSGIAAEQGYILTDDAMRTNIENVFACGAVRTTSGIPRQGISWAEAEEEGLRLAGILIQAYEGRKALCPQTS